MIKISLRTKMAGISFSSILAVAFFGPMVYVTSPQISPPGNQNTIDFSKISIGTPAFAAGSPEPSERNAGLRSQHCLHHMLDVQRHSHLCKI